MTGARRAAALAPALALLACGLAPRIDLGARTWSELPGSVFVLRSDAEPAVVVELARELELFIEVVRTTAGIEVAPPRRPLHIYAIADPELARGIGIGPRTGVRGLHSPTAYGSVILVSVWRYRGATRSTLYHELVHFLLARSGSYVPRWYHEGLAELLSTVVQRDDVVTVGHVPQQRAWTLDWADAQPVAELQAPRVAWREWKDVWRFYATAWLLVHYLHTGESESGETPRARGVDYLGRLARGEPWEEAFPAAFGSGPETLDPALAAHLESVRAGHLRLLHLYAPELRPAEPGPVGVAPAAAVAADLAEVLLSDRQAWATDAAIRVLETALAAEPGDAPARAALAWARARRGFTAAAERELARALAAGASQPRVELQAGRTRLALARAGRRLDRAGLERAREHLRRAASLDAELAAAWAELGATYALDGVDDAPEPGIDALERARALLPSDSGVHLALGKLWTRAGDTARAGEHLRLVLQWSGSEQERAEAEQALEALAGDAGVAARRSSAHTGA